MRTGDRATAPKVRTVNAPADLVGDLWTFASQVEHAGGPDLPPDGIKLPPDLIAVARRGALRALAEAYREDARRERGDNAVGLEDDLAFALPVVEAASPPPPAAPPIVGAAEQAEPVPTLSEAMEKKIELEGLAGKNAKTLHDMELASRLFVSIVGDLPLDRLKGKHVEYVRYRALVIPRMHGRGEFAGLTALEATAKADEMDRDRAAYGASVAAGDPVERLTKATVNKHISSLQKGVEGWYRREDKRAPTPFCHERFSKKEVLKSLRLIRMELTDADLQTLFSSPVFTGHGDAVHQAEQGPNVVRDSKFFVPLMGAYTGARMEELLQVGSRHFRKVDGIDVVAIGSLPGDKVKNPFSGRLVPIPEPLKEVGLLAHVEEMRRRGSRLLFPELKPGGPDDRLGHTFHPLVDRSSAGRGWACGSAC